MKNSHFSQNPRKTPMIFTKNAATQATAHCIITTSAAHFPPSSRFTEAIAATQGV